MTKVYHVGASLGATSLLLSSGRAPNRTSHIVLVLCMLELRVFCFSSLLCVFAFAKHKTAGKVKTCTPVLMFPVCGGFLFCSNSQQAGVKTANREALFFSFLLLILKDLLRGRRF